MVGGARIAMGVGVCFVVWRPALLLLSHTHLRRTLIAADGERGHAARGWGVFASPLFEKRKTLCVKNHRAASSPRPRPL